MIVEKSLKEITLPLRVSEDVYLDTIQQKDKNSFFNLIEKNRGYLRQGVSWLDKCQTLDETMLFIQRSLQDADLDRAIRLGIFFSGDLIGSIIVTANWQSRSFELGYWIDPSFQGRGIITTSCSTILETIFKEFNVKKVLIHTTTDNKKSQSVAKHLGFTQQENSAQRQWLYDQYVDCIWYEKTF